MQIVTAELLTYGVVVDIFPSQAFSWPIVGLTSSEFFPILFNCHRIRRMFEYVFCSIIRYWMRFAESNESCIRNKGPGASGRFIAKGVVDLSSLFKGPFNVPSTPCKRQYNEEYGHQYILSNFYNSTLQIVTIEQKNLNIKADILPRESLRFWAIYDTDYLFTFRCRGTEHSKS